jgi:phosphatidylserine/phosphatidylglycerophosphate/cardiolipin synthase-like enzyme
MKQLVKPINRENDRVLFYPILPHGRGWQSSEGMPLSIWETGKEGKLLHRMIEAIEAARELICMQSFLMEDSELIETLVKAQERGVRVYVLSSAETRIKDTIEEEPDWDRQAKEAYIRLLEEKFKYRFLLRSASYFHAKYLLIDPKTNPKGFLCTNNFTKKAFRENVELAVELHAEQVKELFRIFVYHFWEYAEYEHTANRNFAEVTPTKRLAPPTLEHILLTSPNPTLNSLGRSLKEAIEKAEKSISLSTYQLDKDHPMLQALREKARAGVEARLFTQLTKAYFEQNLKDLLKEGVKVFLNPRTHAKFLLVDGREGYIFTANLKKEGLDQGLEVGIKLNEKQTRDLEQIQRWWANDFEKKALYEIKAKDVESYYTFDEKRRLIEKKLLDESREFRKRVNRVSELLEFFGQKIEPDPDKHRSLKAQLIAEIQDLPNDIKARINLQRDGIFEVIEIEEEAKKDIPESQGKEKAKDEQKEKDTPKAPIKRKLVVIYDDFQAEDVEKLRAYKELPVYYVSRG